MTHTHVEPFRTRYYSQALETDVLTVAGYRGSCSCGWRGQVRSHHSHARDDARRHRRDELEHEEAAPKREDVSPSSSAETS